MSDKLFAHLYLDECMPNLLVTMLQKEGWTVTSALLEGLTGISDSEQLAESIKRNSIFVTSDKNTVLKEIGQAEHLGIIITSRNVRDDDAHKIAQKISVLLNQYAADEFHNVVLFVTP